METKIKKAIFVVCEGPHDAAFLYRILKTQGYRAYSKKIKEFPRPINNFIIGSVKNTAIEEMNLDQIRKSPLPQEVLYKDNILLLIYSTGGDSKKETRKKLIGHIRDIIPVDEKGFNPIEEEQLQFSVCYFFDADTKGITKRLREIETELSQFLNIKKETYFEKNGSIVNLHSINFGAYIFAGKNEFGKLEDILLTLMEENNSREFDLAENYLELHNKKRIYKLKIKYTDGKITEKVSSDKMKYDPLKSKINIAGQLQNSGKANTVIIKDCDYITLEKIKKSSHCSNIINFFARLEK